MGKNKRAVLYGHVESLLRRLRDRHKTHGRCAQGDERLSEKVCGDGLPRRILSDKGSDMAAAKHAIEKYRQQSDGNKPMVLHTATGTPVLIVEGLNAQVQRRMPT